MRHEILTFVSTLTYPSKSCPALLYQATLLSVVIKLISWFSLIFRIRLHCYCEVTLYCNQYNILCDLSLLLSSTLSGCDNLFFLRNFYLSSYLLTSLSLLLTDLHSSSSSFIWRNPRQSICAIQQFKNIWYNTVTVDDIHRVCGCQTSK